MVTLKEQEERRAEVWHTLYLNLILETLEQIKKFQKEPRARSFINSRLRFINLILNNLGD